MYAARCSGGFCRSRGTKASGWSGTAEAKSQCSSVGRRGAAGCTAGMVRVLSTGGTPDEHMCCWLVARSLLLDSAATQVASVTSGWRRRDLPGSPVGRGPVKARQVPSLEPARKAGRVPTRQMDLPARGWTESEEWAPMARRSV